MKIIGINGNPGSGKTTASNILFKDDSKKVIHLDDIFNDIKELLPKRNTDTFKTGDSEAIILNRKGALYKVLNSKFINKEFVLAKKIYANKYLKYVIKKAYKEGIDYIVIEGVHLENYDITYLIDYFIFIEANEEDRVDRLIKRDAEYANIIFKKSLNMSDSIDKSKYDFILENNGSLEDFKDSCDEISENIKNNSAKVKKLKL